MFRNWKQGKQDREPQQLPDRPTPRGCSLGGIFIWFLALAIIFWLWNPFKGGLGVSPQKEELQKILRHVPRWQREAREKLRELNREMTNFAVGGLIDELREKYTDFSKVVDYLDAVREDVIENARDLLVSEEEGTDPDRHVGR
jgi:hypothetical protein